MKRVLMFLPMAAFLAACDPAPLAGPDASTPTPDGGVDPHVEACKGVVAEKLTKYESTLGDWKIADLAKMAEKPAGVATDNTAYAGHYRELADNHPGCAPRASYDGKLFLNTLNQATVAAGVPVQGTDAAAPGYVPGYPCAAKEYTGGTIDKTKPIVVLVHGNSSTPNSWEEYSNSALVDDDPNKAGTQLATASKFVFSVENTTREMLAAKLVKKGYRVIAVDFRTDLTLALKDAVLTAGWTDPMYGDAIGNVDHGWSTPILQSLLAALIKANPDQKISLVGHSLGYTAIQDAVRRLYNDYKAGQTTINPLSRLQHLVLASGAAHGVANGTFNCSNYKTMRGSVNCEMGDRKNWVATDFNNLLNGPEDLFATPCADGDFAYGKKGECGGNVVRYLTVTMRDPATGDLQDEFVSMSSARLSMDKVTKDASGKITVQDRACVENHLIELSDFDPSGFFMDLADLQGFLANHFGSIRSEAGMTKIVSVLDEK
ncbi:MAG TPA: hypothetical protein VGK67_06700 [Myxococcales bacterium]|jgi:pimeloyl-ACP methyl ester carboxylesterase